MAWAKELTERECQFLADRLTSACTDDLAVARRCAEAVEEGVLSNDQARVIRRIALAMLSVKRESGAICTRRAFGGNDSGFGNGGSEP